MYLCIDTTTSQAGVTLVGETVLREEIDPRNASESIIAVIDGLIQKTGIQLAELKGVFVIKGPGSFTGLRVGISVANQFAHQLKIPIIGLRTDEWWAHRTDEADVLYLQSMNRSEIYISQNSKLKEKNSKTLFAIQQLSEFGERKWMGEITEEHRKKLPEGFTEITDLRTPEETWGEIVKSYELKVTSLNPHNLIEPYYGKEAKITKSKKKLSI